MKKFKEFKVNATENKIVHNEVICHLIKLGYHLCALEGGLYLINKSGNVGWANDSLFNSSCKDRLSLDEFFKLTPDDVVIEPERFDCQFIVHGHGRNSPYAWDLDLTDDQIDRIKSIMDEES